LIAPPEIDTDPMLRVVEEGLPTAAPDRSWWRRHSKGVSAAFAILVFAALVIGLYGKRHAFIDSIGAATVSVLAGATLMQVIWLIARSEAWYVCVDAAGGDCGRRPLYRAAAVGYLGNLLNPSFGLAVRIAELRRTAPDTSPGAGVLVAAEMPIVVVEIALAGLCSFTLVAPLGIPWWVPLIALVAGVGIVAGLSGLASRKRHGLWKGIAVLRGLRHRNTIIALTILAVSAQVFRNWLVLRGIGVDVSVWDSMALLIAAAALGLLPVGPSLGVVTTVLILGSKGVPQAAAAGALLTATGAVGALLFGSWALLDRLRTREPARPAGRE
jgi:uncharacterized membrane protein YbhN (UPF0104 family)